ncbi:phosphate ABC transporter substrate-binding protein PstS [Belnapia sp. T18]|uniref:Phosphate-binding protein PstS n=1 Tax=Belnapia arida TaxID=2804533 RepID=A0ABS1UC71_9PROT|nr:phosphate ABC transporter substrate-binding protein PstS [Belnapia arida]MBL6082276.1 phosphate ABC transporter substrate-binding protein PstS [Belnapia arida]
MHRKLFILLVALTALLIGFPKSADAQGMVGAGSTFAHPVLARWGQVFATLQGEGGAYVSAETNLDYEPVGSFGGLMRVLQGAANFAVSDVPLLPEEVDRHSLMQFPLVTGSVVVVTNLPGIKTGSLQLTGSVLADIYLGRITRWSDPAIRMLNPELGLADIAISVLRRLDGSGTTYHFAAFLAAASPDWRSRIGVNTDLQWPVGVGAKGNRELADLVQATPGSIGYVEASQAARLGLSVTAVSNPAGRFLLPDSASIQAATATASWDPARHFYREIADPNGGDAYPIVATAYVLMPRRAEARSRTTIEFFRMCLTERSADAVALGYVPLPEPAVRLVTEYWRTALGSSR